MENSQPAGEVLVAHWFDLGRIAWEPAFTTSGCEVVKPKDVKAKEEVDHKTQDPLIKCPMCGCNVKSS